MLVSHCWSFFFFFNDTATTEIYTLSLHDALPISSDHARAFAPAGDAGEATPDRRVRRPPWVAPRPPEEAAAWLWNWTPDRKSTRLNSSHSQISYAVFCLKKKKHKTPLLYILHRHA